jgi:hypothetical protein
LGGNQPEEQKSKLTNTPPANDGIGPQHGNIDHDDIINQETKRMKNTGYHQRKK